MLISYSFSGDGFFGGMIEALYTEIVIILIFFIYIFYKLRNTKLFGVKVIYSYSSSILFIFLILLLFLGFKTPLIGIVFLSLPLITATLSSSFKKLLKK